MSVFPIVDHVDRAIANLISMFDQADDFQSLVAVFVEQVQVLDNLFFSLIVDRMLSSAVGEGLDEYGRLLNEPRQGFIDSEYRDLLRARILTNLAEGEIERIISVLTLLTSAVRVLYMPTYPAAYIVQYERDGYTTPGYRNKIREQIISITPSGVGVNIVEGALGSFGFEDDDTALGFNEGPWAEII